MDARALVDTGASISCIDAGLAMDLQLPIIDQTSVAGVGGLHQFNMHLAQIRAPALKFTFFGEFAGVDLAAGGQGHTVLIGRDFLSHFHMTYDGPSGAVVLTDPSAPMDVAAWDEE
ncbi:MAG: aspartyl protease family protein [Caulobacteraceae bacterium]